MKTLMSEKKRSDRTFSRIKRKNDMMDDIVRETITIEDCNDMENAMKILQTYSKCV